jgi:chromosome segregation ATPase
VIQSILFFALGFLCAGFLVMLIAPAVLRRAVNLTRKRIEGSLPLTLGEIQADKDSIRAEAAMAIRRLEMNGDKARDRVATQLIEIDRRREEIRSLTEDRDGKSTVIAGLEAQLEAMTASLQQRGEELERLSARLAGLEGEKAALEQELVQLGRLYEEASFASSNRQIQLVARESEIETLASDILHVKAQRKDADAHAQEMALETRKVREALKVEKKRAEGLDRKLERLMTTLADRDEKLERLERNSPRPDKSSGSASVAGQAVAAMLGGEAGLQPDPEDAPAPGAPAADTGVEQEMARLSADRQRLEQRLTALARENRKLKTERGPGNSETAGENARLREQMSELAAEVVHLTALLEGPQSPITKVLDNADGGGQGDAPSLADRIRALQRAAAQGAGASAPEK